MSPLLLVFCSIIASVYSQCEENGFCPTIDCTGQQDGEYTCDESAIGGDTCIEYANLCLTCTRLCDLSQFVPSTSNDIFLTFSCASGRCPTPSPIPPGSPTQSPTPAPSCTPYDCTQTPTTRCTNQQAFPHSCDASSFAPTSPCANQPDECSACCDAYDINVNEFGGFSDKQTVFDNFCTNSSCPTNAPTRAPTTAMPTTQMPTRTPLDPGQTHAPSKTPTDTPSDQPTEPSEQPTSNPSEAPSDNPTKAPSNIPSESPSDVPTESSEEPTSSPSKIPTSPTTASPTLTPLEGADGDGTGDSGYMINGFISFIVVFIVFMF